MRLHEIEKPEERLRRHIDEGGLRRSWVAACAGMRYDSFCKCLQGRRALRADELLQLMQVLHLGLDDFFTASDSNT